MLSEGIYRFYVRNGSQLKPNGALKIQNGTAEILDKGDGTLLSMVEGDLSSLDKLENIIESVNRNHYAYFLKDDSDKAIQEFEGNHDPAAISKEDKQENYSTLSHLKALLEKEEDLEEIEIPEHIVLRGSSPRWED
jgi:hypothetical protein